jgi:hypothetical protein
MSQKVIQNLSAVKNVSAVKGAKIAKVPHPQNLTDNRHRRMTLLDQPMQGDKKFEALSTSAINMDKQ